MPPKAKFTKEEIVSAAIEILRDKGIEAITARELGVRLNSSARPIFTLYRNMDEVLSDTVRAVRDIYNREYIQKGLREALAFRGTGAAYIRFAVEEPQFFRLLFMTEHDESLRAILPRIDENFESIVHSVVDAYGVVRERAEWLYRHLWIYSHGIATLCATGACRFTGEEIETMLTDVFLALFARTQGGEQ